MTVLKKLQFKTPAKINLGLHIHEKRKDGFHELETIFHMVDWFDELELKGISARVISFYSAKPLDEETLSEVLSTHPLVVTIEEHSIIGGVGSAVSQWITSNKIKHVNFIQLSLPDKIFHESGSQKYLREKVGLKASHIAKRVVDQIQNH